MAELHPAIMKFTTEITPDMVLFNIVPRLPAKSLMRFMCVCKQWHAFIKTPMFAKMHLRHVTEDDHQIHHKVLILSTTTPCNFRTIDCEAPEDGFTCARSLPFEAIHKNISIIATLNGLVCVGLKNNEFDLEYTDLILWNPLTGDYKRMSKADSVPDCYQIYEKTFGLCYDSSNDDYKLLSVTYNGDAYLYSSKTDSWRKVDSKDNLLRIPIMARGFWRPAGTLINEALYFLREFKTHRESPWKYSIIRFDSKTEKFMEIAAPPLENLITSRLIFTVLRGSIHFGVTVQRRIGNSSNRCREIELWRMDTEGVWVKVVTYSPTPRVPWYEGPLHIMRNGIWLMHSTYGSYLYKVDMEKHTKDKLGSYSMSNMHIPLHKKYIETFVSPNQ